MSEEEQQQKYHRIELKEFDPELEGEWVDILKSRTYGARLKVQDAAQLGIEDYKLTLLEQSVARWSYQEPATREAFSGLDEFVGEYIYEQITAWYTSRRRPEARTKSAEAGADGGAGEPQRHDPE